MTNAILFSDSLMHWLPTRMLMGMESIVGRAASQELLRRVETGHVPRDLESAILAGHAGTVELDFKSPVPSNLMQHGHVVYTTSLSKRYWRPEIESLIVTLDESEMLDHVSGRQEHGWRDERPSRCIDLPPLEGKPHNIGASGRITVRRAGDDNTVAPVFIREFKIETGIFPSDPSMRANDVQITVYASLLPVPIAAEVFVRRAGKDDYESAGNWYLPSTATQNLRLKWPFKIKKPTRIDFRIVPSAVVAIENLGPDEQEYYGCTIEKYNVLVVPVPPGMRRTSEDDRGSKGT